ncbi:ComEC/Rec2 family competence protein [Agaribacterium haliotis]|uniref:ComEC/Rec2 family competence protein n=1 Tax=Agaribacterium haliotis TaxID=2013869 RepID=UPI001304492C|nr:ComEC/Rec2 family competence protein [Agaribacterium haliotis]
MTLFTVLCSFIAACFLLLFGGPYWPSPYSFYGFCLVLLASLLLACLQKSARFTSVLFSGRLALITRFLAFCLPLVAVLFLANWRIYALLDAQLEPALEQKSLLISGRISRLQQSGAGLWRLQFEIDTASLELDADAKLRLEGRTGELASLGKAILGKSILGEAGLSNAGPGEGGAREASVREASVRERNERAFAVNRALAKLESRRLRLSWRTERQLELGQRWRLMVKLRRPRGFVNQASFDYQAWLLARDIVATGYVQNDARSLASGLPRLLQAAPDSAVQNYKKQLGAALKSFSSWPLFAALILGEQGELSAEQWRLFRESGTVHLLVISGLHIALLAGFVYLCFSVLFRPLLLFVPYRYWQLLRLLASAAAAAFYASMAGFSLPTLRAFSALMLVYICLAVGRRCSAWHFLALVAAIFLVHNPLLLSQQSFVLSFGAVAILLALGQKMRLVPGHSTQRAPVAAKTKSASSLIHEFGLLSLLSRGWSGGWFGTLAADFWRWRGVCGYLSQCLAALKQKFVALVLLQSMLSLVMAPLLLLMLLPVSGLAVFANLLLLPLMALVLLPLCLLGCVLLPLQAELAGFVFGLADWALQGLLLFLELLSSSELLFYLPPDAAARYLPLMGLCALLLLVPRCFGLGPLLILLAAALGLAPIVTSVQAPPLSPNLGPALYEQAPGIETGIEQGLNAARRPRSAAGSAPYVRPAHLPARQLSLQVLDVGQGLALFLQFDRQRWLYDLGARFSPNFAVADKLLYPWLRQRGIDSLDKLFISHADNDHAGGLEQFVALLGIAQALSGQAKVLNQRLDQPMFQACEQGQHWRSRDQYVAGHVASLAPPALAATKPLWQVSVLWPLPENSELGLNKAPPAPALTSNNQSCVLLLEYVSASGAVRRVLLMGDVDRRVEHELMQQKLLPETVDILLLGHHGSLTSSSAAFVEALRPKHMVVSAGYNNRYGHPHAAIVRRADAVGAKLWNTAWHGALLFQLQGDEFVIRAERCAQKRLWYRDEGYCL